jgi:soluble lytic murein transglycosylase-like protein
VGRLGKSGFIRSAVLAAVFVFSGLLPVMAGPLDGPEDLRMCFEEAGVLYGISPLLLRGIALNESAFDPVAVNWNRNGSYDFGVMQINSFWYRKLGRDAWLRLADPCYNIHVGAWILAQCVGRHGYNWKAVGCYNSSRPEKRNAYAWRIYRTLRTSYAEHQPSGDP